MDLRIRYARTTDGIRIAYDASGEVLTDPGTTRFV